MHLHFVERVQVFRTGVLVGGRTPDPSSGS